VKSTEIVAILGELPCTKGLSQEHMQAVGDCANTRKLAAGEYLWRQGEESALFYLIQSGQLALEISVPGQGPFRIETLSEGEFLGCSNLLASARCQFDARALTPVSCLAFEGDRLQLLMEGDQQLGYALLKCMAPMMAHKLESARLRLLDLHGLSQLRGSGAMRPVFPRMDK
jgi:CRP/FNR family transcriptional regulator, cyclic AMP receptor protein